MINQATTIILLVAIAAFGGLGYYAKEQTERAALAEGAVEAQAQALTKYAYASEKDKAANARTITEISKANDTLGQRLQAAILEARNAKATACHDHSIPIESQRRLCDFARKSDQAILPDSISFDSPACSDPISSPLSTRDLEEWLLSAIKAITTANTRLSGLCGYYVAHGLINASDCVMLNHGAGAE